MSAAVVIREFATDEWRTYRALRLRALADSPQSFGSTLAAETVLDDAHWTRRLVDAVRSELQLPLLACSGEQAIGLAWCIHEPDQTRANLYQMWVAPEQRCVGTGRLLLATCREWAAHRGAAQLLLSVTCDNEAAHRLYTRFGFEPAGEPEPLRPGAHEQAQPMRLAL